ncbi:DciA family protein [Salininema proteolyticum]|uniref:DciA family protein n=1 Tax=Salininema proteolyticum TaxID=1607685 RepID=A0ABV8TU89_9ACTN
MPDRPYRRRRPRRRVDQQWSGPGPDERDPQTLASVLDRLSRQRGWRKQVADHTVFGRWESIVGPDIANHCRPEKLEDGRLTVVAESSAWATQLRLMSRQLYISIVRAVGSKVVRELNIQGPVQHRPNYGPRRVRNR